MWIGTTPMQDRCALKHCERIEILLRSSYYLHLIWLFDTKFKVRSVCASSSLTEKDPYVEGTMNKVSEKSLLHFMQHALCRVLVTH